MVNEIDANLLRSQNALGEGWWWGKTWLNPSELACKMTGSRNIQSLHGVLLMILNIVITYQYLNLQIIL